MPEDNSLSGLYITKDMLKEYCEYFINNNYKIVSLNEAYNIFVNKEEIDNTNLLVLTFDDGYEDNYTLGFPILKKYGAKFNVNVIARYTDENRENYLSWDQIKEMNKSGLLELGNHTYDSHIYVEDYKGDSEPILKALLPNESEEERKNRIFNDLDKADDLISKNGGNNISIMAYPYGVPPKDMQKEIAEKFNYSIELMVTEGVNRKEEDFTKLNRFTVDGFEKPKDLERRMKFYKGLNFLNKERRSIRDLINFNF
jgi:peptidoglycan/xylan/chitin deacetylase (PgdA/CDA1 family)